MTDEKKETTIDDLIERLESLREALGNGGAILVFNGTIMCPDAGNKIIITTQPQM